MGRQVSVTVERGDTLSRLMIAKYGAYDNDMLQKIKNDNPSIKDVNRIYAGETIVFPQKEQTGKKMMRQQQRPIRTRRLRFSPLFASHLASRDYDFYGEADFNAHIRVERRRTERTKKPLLLVLLDINGLEKDRSRKRAIERIAYALCSCSRKIDIKGWYKANSVFGIVFTELPGGVRR